MKIDVPLKAERLPLIEAATGAFMPGEIRLLGGFGALSAQALARAEAGMLRVLVVSAGGLGPRVAGKPYQCFGTEAVVTALAALPDGVVYGMTCGLQRRRVLGTCRGFGPPSALVAPVNQSL